MASRCEPEHLIWQVSCEVARLRSRELAARERYAHEHRFLWVQPSLDGSARLFAQGPIADIATIVGTADAFAPRPLDAEEPDQPSRGAQRFDGLVDSAIAALGGGTGRAKPRITLTYRAQDLSDLGKSSGASVLWAHPGAPPSISAELTEMLTCDAEIVPVLFEGATPVAVGTTTKTIPHKVRTAVFARDGGCRFPGCSAPVAWCDVHHTMPGVHDPTLCLALCRRCHRRIHHGSWQIRPVRDGLIEFHHRGQIYASQPRFAPARE